MSSYPNIDGLTHRETEILLESSQPSDEMVIASLRELPKTLRMKYEEIGAKSCTEIKWGLKEVCLVLGYVNLADEIDALGDKESIFAWIGSVERDAEGFVYMVQKRVENQAEIDRLCNVLKNPEFAPFDVRHAVIRGFLAKEDEPDPEAIALGVHMELAETIHRLNHTTPDLASSLGYDIETVGALLEQMIEDTHTQVSRIHPPEDQETKTALGRASERILYKLNNQKNTAEDEKTAVSNELLYDIDPKEGLERFRLKTLKKRALERFIKEVTAEIAYCEEIKKLLA